MLKIFKEEEEDNQLRSFCLYLFCRETGVTGKITVNGKNRSSNSESFRNISAYIHQDDALRPYLTVREAMTVATHLKLGFNVTKEYKQKMVNVFLNFFFLNFLSIAFVN